MQTRNTKSSKAQNFVVQGSILAVAGIIVRLIGMLYRIPLIEIIGKRETVIILRPSAFILFC